MKALLIDVDSKRSLVRGRSWSFANLALMHVSGWHRARGDTVLLYQHLAPSGRRFNRGVPLEVLAWNPDRVYVSCLFTWNAGVGRALADMDWGPQATLVLEGGTGFDHGKPAADRARLPIDIEAAPPDYDLYGMDYALGFCNRGCERSCTFCDVPAKEGKIVPALYRPPWRWVPDGFRKALLLDNDLALYDDATQEEIVGWFRDAGVYWSLTQGWDIRCTTPERAARLAECKPWDYKFTDRILYTAWDYVGIEPWIRRGLRMLLDAGFKGRDIECYMIVGHDPKTRGPTPVGDPADRERALHRFDILWREFGVYPFVMPFDNRKDDPWIRAFARWVNRKVFKSCTWEEYARRPREALRPKS